LWRRQIRGRAKTRTQGRTNGEIEEVEAQENKKYWGRRRERGGHDRKGKAQRTMIKSETLGGRRRGQGPGLLDKKIVVCKVGFLSS